MLHETFFGFLDLSKSYENKIYILKKSNIPDERERKLNKLILARNLGFRPILIIGQCAEIRFFQFKELAPRIGP